MKDGAWKTPEFLAKFPFGYLPAFEGVDGVKLQECGAIADYCELCQSGLMLVLALVLCSVCDIGGYMTRLLFSYPCLNHNVSTVFAGGTAFSDILQHRLSFFLPLDTSLTV